MGMLSCFALFLLGTEFIASTIDGWVHGLEGLLFATVGVTTRVASFEEGMVDLRDVAYFTIGTTLVLVLNGFWMEGRLRPGQRRLFATATFVAAAIFFLGNWLLRDVPLGRFDFTAGRLYTISPASRKILNGLKAPATVKLYISPEDKMPTGFKTLERDVLDKLDEFRLAAKGKFQYKVFHMEAVNAAPSGNTKSSEESLEAILQRKGIQPFQVQSIEEDELGVRLIYAAMAIAYKEKPEDILPRVTPANLNELEYLLLSRIYRMTLAETPTIALVAPFEETPLEPGLRTALEQLGQKVPERQVKDDYRLASMLLESEGYKVSRVELKEDGPLPSGARTLVILELRQLTEAQQKTISRFFVEGGSVFLATQSYLFDYTTSGIGEITVIPHVQSPNVNPLLRAWGLGLEERILLDDNQEALNVGGGMRMGPFAFTLPLKLPVHIRINPDRMNPEVSITSHLSPMLYLWGSALSFDQAAAESHHLNARVLLRSSNGSWLIPPSASTA